MMTTTTTNRTLQSENHEEQKIVLLGVPTDVNFSLLSNAIGFYISQAFCWSLKFVDRQFASECIEMYSYQNELVGRLQLRPRRSHYTIHAEHTGCLQLFLDNDDDDKKLDCASIASALNDLVKTQPLLVTGLDGTVVQADSLFFKVEATPFVAGKPLLVDTMPRTGTTRAISSVPPTRGKEITYVSMLSAPSDEGNKNPSLPGKARARATTNSGAQPTARGQENTYVSMLSAPSEEKNPFFPTQARTRATTNNGAQPTARGKENVYVSMLTSSSGDRQQKAPYQGTREPEWMVRGKTRRYHERTVQPTVPLGDILEEEDYWL